MNVLETKLKTQQGEMIIEAPFDGGEVIDISDKNIDRMARGFILGSQSITNRKDIREKLDTKVTKRIGRKGKYLVDKLFELIEGVYIVDKIAGNLGQNIRYYKVPPSLNAIVYALDRVLGKPKQFSEHTEEKRGIVLVEHVIKNLASNPYKNANGVRKNIKSGDGGRTGIDKRGSQLSERVDIGIGSVAL